MKLDKSQILIASLLSITTCSGLVLSMSHTYADDSVTDNITITVPESCSISSTIDTAHTATFSAGTWSGAEGSDYENGIGKTTLTTFCNDNNGFSIYAIGFTDDTLGTTTLVGSNTNIAIPTKAYASGDTTSNWSMKITKVENPLSGDPVTWNPSNLTISNNFNSWHAVPDDYTRVAEYQATTGSSTTDTTLGAKLETTYATFISPTQPADTYTGKVKYVLVHPYAPDPDPYKPSTSVSIEDAYATAGKQKLNGYYKMQDMSNSICSAVTLQDDASETILIDSRDNKTYYVAKLQDGNCWMTQNLDHDIDSSYNYNSTNSDVPANWNDTLTSTYATNNTTWIDSYTTPESYDPGELYWNGTTTDDYESNQTSATGDSHYHLGNYYNWIAAVAMQDISNYALQNNTDVNQSICPAGWTLPKGGNNTSGGSFQYLIERYGWDDESYTIENPNIWNTAYKLPLSGMWWGRLTNVGRLGQFWSSTTHNADEDAYNLLAWYNGKIGNLDGYDYAEYYYLGYGSTVRCVAR